jgi:hypothetical protein
MSNIGAKDNQVIFYDSGEQHHAQELIRQATQLLQCQGNSIEWRYANVQNQLDGWSCGYFAIANAVQLYHHHDSINFHHIERITFNKLNLQPELIQQFQAGISAYENHQNWTITTFSSHRGKLDKYPRSTEFRRVEIHCWCRGICSTRVESMVYCNRCKGWFHQNCEQVDGRIFEDGYEYLKFVSSDWKFQGIEIDD